MASEKLLLAAQSIMDAYFQDYAPADGFFRIEDFADWLGKAYGKYADETAKEIYKNTLQEMGIGQITFSQDWWVKKVLDVKEEAAPLEFKYMGFTYDMQQSGIQEIMPIGNHSCGSFMRTTLTDLWILGNMSRNNIVWWYTDFDKIKFKTSANLPKQIAVYYIPSPDDDEFKIPPSKAFEIATLAFNFMVAAKKETQFVDDTNNANKNILPQTETDSKQVNPIK